MLADETDVLTAYNLANINATNSAYFNPSVSYVN